MKDMTEYVVGFLIFRGNVLLIQKRRPEWQKGRFNGIGGHIEAGEMPGEAMAREFMEEAAWKTKPEQWRYFGVVDYPKARVHLFCMKDLNIDPRFLVHTQTDEGIRWIPTDGVHKFPVIENLNWMIPMAIRDGEWFYSLKGVGLGPNS
jgi:8-oxo-dGTP diphosphatase